VPWDLIPIKGFTQVPDDDLGKYAAMLEHN
jgi:hypothetical protein